MSNAFLVGTRKGLIIYRKTNGNWKPEPLLFAGVKVPMALPDPRDGTLYAAVDHGHFGTKMHRSSNGMDWEELPPPAYPERPADVEPTLCPVRQKEIPWSLEMIWSLETGGANEAGVLWCGTLPGGLFKSNNRGENWELVRSLWDVPERASWAGGGYDYPGIHSICVDPRDASKITVAVSTGGIWQTADGARSWQLVGAGMKADYMPPELVNDPGSQDVHRLVACPVAPDVFWNQHHCSIYRSTDGAQNFTELTNAIPSRFGFAVAAHPTDPLTAWFVPAIKDEMRLPVDGKVVVSRTTDGGETFDVFGTGLPSENASHLVYRHCLEVDSSGRLLVMGSTTGSLWISEDAGESWTRLTAELAPIYCVRWM